MSATSDNFFAASKDEQTAIRDYLNTLYGTTYGDVSFLIQKYLNARTTSDNANTWQSLIAASQLGTS